IFQRRNAVGNFNAPDPAFSGNRNESPTGMGATLTLSSCGTRCVRSYFAAPRAGGVAAGRGGLPAIARGVSLINVGINRMSALGANETRRDAGNEVNEAKLSLRPERRIKRARSAHAIVSTRPSSETRGKRLPNLFKINRESNVSEWTKLF